MAIHSTVPVVAKAEVTNDPASIAANAAAVITLTVPGVKPGFPVQVWCETLDAALSIGNAFCSAANTVKFTLSNNSGSAVDQASSVFKVIQR